MGTRLADGGDLAVPQDRLALARAGGGIVSTAGDLATMLRALYCN